MVCNKVGGLVVFPVECLVEKTDERFKNKERERDCMEGDTGEQSVHLYSELWINPAIFILMCAETRRYCIVK